MNISVGRFAASIMVSPDGCLVHSTDLPNEGCDSVAYLQREASCGRGPCGAFGPRKDILLRFESSGRGPAILLEDWESGLVIVFRWKFVEAAFWRRLRAGVSAIGLKISHHPFHTEQYGSLPPEPESSFLDGLDDLDWTVPDRALPDVCDGLAGIVPDARWAG